MGPCLAMAWAPRSGRAAARVRVWCLGSAAWPTATSEAQGLPWEQPAWGREHTWSVAISWLSLPAQGVRCRLSMMWQDFPCQEFGGEQSMPYPVFWKRLPPSPPAEVAQGAARTPCPPQLSFSLPVEGGTADHCSGEQESRSFPVCAVCPFLIRRLLPKCLLRLETRLGWPLLLRKFVSLKFGEKKILSSAIFVVTLTFILFYFCFFRATPVAYGSSQARGLIRAIAAGLHYSHSNARSELCL